jgi:hypothetical protein
MAATSVFPESLFEVAYVSLFQPGRSLAFPCDARGHVDIDALSDKARLNYLFARAMVGRDYSLPRVCRAVMAL